ncbi:MAG: hypothetical protein GY711_32730 [bacterium]|nr:hypothetical protein [bacterium]
MPRRLFAPLALALLPACRSISVEQFAAAARNSGVRCVAVEPDMTVVSPYAPGRTAEYVDLFRDSADAIFTAFGVEGTDLSVYLEPVDMPGFRIDESGDHFELEGVQRPAHNGVVGLAGERRGSDGHVIVLYVPKDQAVRTADGREIRGTFRFDQGSTVRHELTHIAANLAGLEGPTWFDEGIAIEISSMRVEGGVLLPGRGDSLSLAAARRIHAEHSLEELLAWQERGDRLHRGDEDVFRAGRPLAHALMLFLLQRVQGDTLLESLRTIHSMSAAELLGLEDDWHRWLG